MEQQVLGIHHLTAIAGDPQQNLDFYAGALGLRLVKLTVNFDDPETYHFYFGDREGRPGTLLTFFPWPGAPRGRRGSGQVSAIAFSVPPGSLDYWSERLQSRNVALDAAPHRFGEALALRDPDGLRLELVAAPDEREPWTDGGVPAEHAIRGFHGVTLAVEGYERTASVVEALGFQLARQEGNHFRYSVGRAAPASLVDLECVPDLAPGRIGAGVVHHVAWRTGGEPEQEAWRRRVAGLGLNVTPIIDRKYFRSIYFREPGGVLFEIATDPPGMTVDEPVDRLGAALVLPAWLEQARKSLELRLPPVRLPELARGA